MKLHEATDSIEYGITTKKTPDPIHNWFFNPDKENYSHKVIDFANARYQPTTVDIKDDQYYRAQTVLAETEAEKRGNGDEDQEVDNQDMTGGIEKGKEKKAQAQKDILMPVQEPAKKVEQVQPTQSVQATAVKEPVQQVQSVAVAQDIESAQPAQSAPVIPVKEQVQSMQSVSTESMKEALQPVLHVQAIPKPDIGQVQVPVPTQVQAQVSTQAQVPVPLQAQSQLPVAAPVQATAQAQVNIPAQIPVVEPEKREGLKNFITQEPVAVQAEVPAQVQQTNFEAGSNRDEFKNFISQEPKVIANRPAKFNFDVLKRNRLKDFLSKNPALSKRPDNGVKNKKEALA
jgi:hypothetical protein